MTWKTIDSGPKKGNVLLALDNGLVTEGYWGCGRYNRSKKDYEMGWVTGPNSGIVNATHWMPLPQPPQTQEEKESV